MSSCAWARAVIVHGVASAALAVFGIASLNFGAAFLAVAGVLLANRVSNGEYGRTFVRVFKICLELSPLVLDLDGDGVEADGTTFFDHEGDGFLKYRVIFVFKV